MHQEEMGQMLQLASLAVGLIAGSIVIVDFLTKKRGGDIG